MDIKEAIARQDIFGSAIKDIRTFEAWLTFLSALFGLPMSDSEAEIFRACTGRATLPSQPFTESWLICGRRAGKSFMMALIAVFLATFRDYRGFLGIGERATVMIVAADRRQARVCLRYIGGLLKLPVFAKMLEREAAESFDLTNGVTIEVHTASIRAVRGYSIAAAICDEIAFWPQENSASPDVEILDSIRPAMATIPGAVLICASSPYARRGALWDAYRRHWGKDKARALVWQASTRTINPTVPQSVIDEAMERDPASAAAEFGANFRTDVEGYLAREIVEAAIVPGRFELPPVRGNRYAGFVDPSGGASDDMTMAIAHKEGETVVVDCIRAVKPPFSPDSVVQEFAATLKSYGLHTAKSDYYGGEWPAERFKTHGIKLERSDKPKSQIYVDAIPLFSAKRVELLDHPKLAAQLIGLERRTARGGRDSIDHAPNGHDDIANAVCGALTMLTSRRQLELNINMDALNRLFPANPRRNGKIAGVSFR